MEKPTRSDLFNLWTKAWRVLSSPSYKLVHQLGGVIASPHRPDLWFTNEDQTAIYRKTEDGPFDVFEPAPREGARTRFGEYFTLIDQEDATFQPTHRASVVETPGGHVRFHSAALIPQPAPTPDSLRHVLVG